MQNCYSFKKLGIILFAKWSGCCRFDAFHISILNFYYFVNQNTVFTIAFEKKLTSYNAMINVIIVYHLLTFDYAVGIVSDIILWVEQTRLKSYQIEFYVLEISLTSIFTEQLHICLGDNWSPQTDAGSSHCIGDPLVDVFSFLVGLLSFYTKKNLVGTSNLVQLRKFFLFNSCRKKNIFVCILFRRKIEM